MNCTAWTTGNFHRQKFSPMALCVENNIKTVNNVKIIFEMKIFEGANFQMYSIVLDIIIW